MRRRLLIAIASGALWAQFSANAQPAMPVVGFLNGQSAEGWTSLTAAFRQGLGESGYVEGRNVAIEYRWAQSEYDRLPALARELVDRRVAVIVASGGDAATDAARSATKAIPIVFFLGADPVGGGYVDRLSRPGGNATGVTLIGAPLDAKRLELLREVVPSTAAFAVLANPKNSRFDATVTALQGAARTMGVRVQILKASAEGEFDAAFAAVGQRRAGGLVVTADAMFLARHDRLVALAARHSIPAIYNNREVVEAGGLMSYGPKSLSLYRRLGALTGKILKGAKPADLPVEQPTEFELAVNLRTAKALGLTLRQTFLMRADKVVE